MKDCNKKQDGINDEHRGENQAIGGNNNQSASRDLNISNNARGSALKPSLTKVNEEAANEEIIVEPIYMILDKENNILICDYSTNRIILLDSELNFKRVLARQQEEYQVEPTRIKSISRQYLPPKIPEDRRAVDDFKRVDIPQKLPSVQFPQHASISFPDTESMEKSKTPDTIHYSEDIKLPITYPSIDKRTTLPFLDFSGTRTSKTRDETKGIDDIRPNKQLPLAGPKKASLPAPKNVPRMSEDVKRFQPCVASKPEKPTRQSNQKSMRSCCDSIVKSEKSFDPQLNRNHCHDKLKAEWRKRCMTPTGTSTDNKSSNSRTIAKQCCKCGKLIIKRGLLSCGEAKYPRADHPSECGLNSNFCALGNNENKCPVESWPIGDGDVCTNNSNKSTKNSTPGSNKDKRSNKKKHHKSISQNSESKHSSNSKNQDKTNKNYSAMFEAPCPPCPCIDCEQVRPLEKDCHSPALCHYCSLHICPSDYRKLCETNPEKDINISGDCYQKSCFQSKQAETGSTKPDGLQMLCSAPIKLERPYRLCLDEENKLLFVASSSIYNGNQLIVFKY